MQILPRVHSVSLRISSRSHVVPSSLSPFSVCYAGESFEDCAVREVKEETGLDIEKIEVVKLINNVILDGPQPSHFVVGFVRAVQSDLDQEPVNIEPDKCDGWAWYEWSSLPNPLLPAFETLVKSGFSPYSSPSFPVINA